MAKLKASVAPLHYLDEQLAEFLSSILFLGKVFSMNILVY